MADDWTQDWPPTVDVGGQDFSGGIETTADDALERATIRRYCDPIEFDCPLRYDEDVARQHGYAGILAPGTVVRSSFMNQNFSESFWLEPILEGELAFPAGEVAEPFIDAEDIADVAVAALTEDGHAGLVYEVTGPRLLTFVEAVGEIVQATGRDIRYVPVLLEQYASPLREAGLPADYASELRHTAESLLHAQGASARDVMETLGHSDVRVTLNVYTHLFEERKHAIAARMDAALETRPSA